MKTLMFIMNIRQRITETEVKWQSVQTEGNIYIEEVFLLNLIMNLYLLRLTGIVLKRRSGLFRILSGSMLGAMGYCVILCFLQIDYEWKVMAGMLPIGMLMLWLGLGIRQKKELLYGTGWMFTFAFLLGGFIIFLKGRLPFLYGREMVMIQVAGIGFVGYELLKTGLKRYLQKREQRLQTVTISADIGNVEIVALVDTGNGLIDPISQKPVAVLEEEIWKRMTKWMRPEKYRVIPFHSIGKEHGLLYGYEVELMEVEGEMSTRQHKDVVIAVFKGKLSKGGGYQMILPPELSI